MSGFLTLPYHGPSEEGMSATFGQSISKRRTMHFHLEATQRMTSDFSALRRIGREGSNTPQSCAPWYGRNRARQGLSHAFTRKSRRTSTATHRTWKVALRAVTGYVTCPCDLSAPPTDRRAETDRQFCARCLALRSIHGHSLHRPSHAHGCAVRGGGAVAPALPRAATTTGTCDAPRGHLASGVLAIKRVPLSPVR